MVAPSLDRTLYDTFWTVHVPQIVQQEPAARHAVLAVSALHEHFVASLPGLASSCLDGVTGLTARLSSDAGITSRTAYALRHYNSAIKLVLDDRISNSNVLLTLSLLFTCIELLQGGVDAAAQHCQYGVRIHKQQPLDSELSAAFYQLGFFSNTFDSSSTLFIPKSCDLQETPCLTVVGEFDSMGQAFQKLDAIMAHGAAILRLAIESRDGKNGTSSMTEVTTEQFHVRRALGLWWESFTAIKRRLTTTQLEAGQHAEAFRLLEARWLVSHILIGTCLAASETIFDSYLSEFQRLVELAQQEKIARDARRLSSPNFSFDMGYLPLLHIVGMKCRSLRTRVHALALMKDLSCDREVVWDACFLYASVKFAIELEHGLSLDERCFRDAAEYLYTDQCLPHNAQRVVGYINASNVSWAADSDGKDIVYRRVRYYVSDPDGTVGPLWNYTTMRL